MLGETVRRMRRAELHDQERGDTRRGSKREEKDKVTWTVDDCGYRGGGNDRRAELRS